MSGSSLTIISFVDLDPSPIPIKKLSKYERSYLGIPELPLHFIQHFACVP
jgi:hypothetical protein